MAKLSREQAEKAVEMKKEGIGYREIESRLSEEYGKENVPSFPTISKNIKPVLEGSKSLDDIFSEDNGEKKEKQEDEIEQGDELKVEHEPKSEGEDENNRLLYVLWIAFFILIMILLVI